jgi:hypothetical protein
MLYIFLRFALVFISLPYFLTSFIATCTLPPLCLSHEHTWKSWLKRVMLRFLLEIWVQLQFSYLLKSLSEVIKSRDHNSHSKVQRKLKKIQSQPRKIMFLIIQSYYLNRYHMKFHGKIFIWCTQWNKQVKIILLIWNNLATIWHTFLRLLSFIFFETTFDFFVESIWILFVPMKTMTVICFFPLSFTRPDRAPQTITILGLLRAVWIVHETKSSSTLLDN